MDIRNNDTTTTTTGSSNLIIPTSVGALLAEEWMINPYSALPSFLEMMFIQEASRSSRKALQSGLDAVERSLLVIQRRQQQQQLSSPASEQEEEDSSSADDRRVSSTIEKQIKAIFNLIQRCRYRLTYHLRNTIHYYGPEIRCLVIYLLERQCLYSASGATTSESIYGGKRVKLLAASDSSSSTTHQRQLVELSKAEKTRLALILAFGPYLREKIESSTSTTASRI